MKYIIMCGGKYAWAKQLQAIKGETIVARTIRLLRENGVEDIAISSNNDAFEQFDVPVLRHDNPFIAFVTDAGVSYWVDAFYPTNEPTCYIFGDVVYSPQAIKTIVETPVKEVMFFASAPPFSPNYIKHYAEPFAFKVEDISYFFDCVNLVKVWQDKRMFRRVPIAWELWQVIKGTPINEIDYTNYVVINDYTCDIDQPTDLGKLEAMMDMGLELD